VHRTENKKQINLFNLMLCSRTLQKLMYLLVDVIADPGYSETNFGIIQTVFVFPMLSEN
jgi:ATP/ADP translocase